MSHKYLKAFLTVFKLPFIEHWLLWYTWSHLTASQALLNHTSLRIFSMRQLLLNSVLQNPVSSWKL